MLPLIPKSVKLEPELNIRLKSAAGELGYSENQFIAESVKATLDGADDENNPLPRIILLLRTARNHGKNPGRYGEPTPIQPAGKHLKWWWGAD